MGINIIVDVTVEEGRLSRIDNILRKSGFQPLIYPPSLLRLHVSRLLEDASLSESILRLLQVLIDNNKFWKTMCVEIYGTLTPRPSIRQRISPGDDHVIFVEKRGNTLVASILWVKPSHHIPLIPGSLRRKCVENAFADKLFVDKVMSAVNSLRQFMIDWRERLS